MRSTKLVFRPFERLKELLEEAQNYFLPVGTRGILSEVEFYLSLTSKKNSLGEVKLPERFNFLRGLLCREVEGISVGRKFDYRGFVFKNFVVLDSPGYGNAIFVVKNTDDWVDEVSFEKELLKKSHIFVKKINHCGDWRNRLLNTLNS